MATQWLKKSDLRRKVGGSDSTLYRLIKAGALPAPTYHGPRSPRWDEAAVDAALRQLTERSAEQARQAAALTAKAREARERKRAEQRDAAGATA